jgi:hypothetical protein
MDGDISGAVFILCLFILIVITIGDPDIIDGLIKIVNK